MAKYSLDQTGSKNLLTTFRYEVTFPNSGNAGSIGMNDQLTCFCTSAQLPKAMQEAIVWNMPFGMQNHQAGVRTVEPISLEFVVDSDNSGGTNMYNLLSFWCNSTFDLNTGLNKGKGKYAMDGIRITVKKEDGTTAHSFELLRAFPTTVEYGTVSSESKELLKVSMTLIYDNFKRNNGTIV
jgi:hypothetical protein